MTNKIKRPAAYLYLIGNKENIPNLKEWIKLLTQPFKNKLYSPKTFHVSSWLHKETEGLLPDEKKDLVRIDFPTTISGLYLKTDKDYDDEGCIILSIGNQARISFATENHSVTKYEKMFSGKSEGISGTYSSIVRIYLTYLKELMAVPKTQ